MARSSTHRASSRSRTRSEPERPNARNARAEARSETGGGTGGRAIWTGSISFGLLQIPVSLYTAEKRSEEIHFRMLDKEDLSPIRFERVNASTGRKVEWQNIVKGYEIEPERFVVIEPEELAKANVEATQTIDIQDFVDRSEIAPAYFETPYFIVPQKRSTRAYVLLREALVAKGAAAVATFVLRTRTALAVLLPVGDALMLEVLRFGHELKDESELPLPDARAGLPLPKRELDMAEKLIDDMMVPWCPAKYKDTYYADVMKIIEEKAKTGSVTEHHVPEKREAGAEVVDLFDVLQRSIRARGKKHADNDHAATNAGPRRPGPKKATRRSGKKTAAA